MLKIIAAVADNGVIGRKGKLPWKLRDDLKWFKEQTEGHPVVMGHKTLCEIIGQLQKPLPGRENLVLTRHPGNIKIDGVKIVTDFEQVVEMGQKKDVFVIGGAELYKLALPFATQLYLTRVHAKVEGDTLFPTWNKDEWEMTDNTVGLGPDARNEYAFTHEIHDRVRNQFIEMTNCRTEEQRVAMQEILGLGICPFCPENRRRWHLKENIWSGNHWVVSHNMWPYPNSQTHLILFLKEHATKASEISPGAWEELGTVVRKMESRFEIPGGGLYLRFGEPLWTGATIRHIHAHIAVKADLKTEAIKFYLG